MVIKKFQIVRCSVKDSKVSQIVCIFRNCILNETKMFVFLPSKFCKKILNEGLLVKWFFKTNFYSYCSYCSLRCKKKQIKELEFNMENLAEEWKIESKDAVNACSECTVMHLHTLLHPPLLCGCNFSSFHGPVCCLKG